ncbi:MAG TPA: hypothetical protein VE715_07965 [Blastocatellia bacterium]|nr:hypothetical protein [Blastocatellia bacterium]
MKQFALFFAALLCASLTAASANAQDYDDISVKAEMVTEARSSSGYDECRVTIINHSPTKPHRVTVVAYEVPYGATISEISRVVEAAPSSIATVSMFRPQSPVGGGGWAVTIDGRRQRFAVNVDFSRASSWSINPGAAFYVISSRDVEKIGLMDETAVVEGFKNVAGVSEVAYLSYKSPISEWSANWLGYSGFDAVALTAEELREAPDAVRSALWRYAECGGSLLIIGAWEIPRQWRSRRVSSIEVEEEEKAGVAGKKVSRSLPEATQTYNVGFGLVTMIDAADIKSLLPTQWEAIKLSWKNSRPRYERYYDIIDINRYFTVVEKIGIPVRGLFVLMLTFVVVIGPINLIWLARRRKKIWMLWTAPVIALVACLAVTGFALLGEGVSATSRTEAFTILDESSHRATTVGWTAFYAPITPGEGLHFNYDTELAPVLPEQWRYGGSAADRTIDFSNDQHLDSGWITARVPAYFKFRKSETRRERLTIRRSVGDSISVVNGLGAGIRELWLADRNGRIYLARGIQAGAEAKLSLANLNLGENSARLRELFTGAEWLKEMQEVERNPQSYLAPGSYLAALDASPFVEEGLKGVKTRRAKTLVYGVGAPIAEEER